MRRKDEKRYNDFVDLKMNNPDKSACYWIDCDLSALQAYVWT